jgi:hypothetical protein
MALAHPAVPGLLSLTRCREILFCRDQVKNAVPHFFLKVEIVVWNYKHVALFTVFLIKNQHIYPGKPTNPESQKAPNCHPQKSDTPNHQAPNHHFFPSFFQRFPCKFSPSTVLPPCSAPG